MLTREELFKYIDLVQQHVSKDANWWINIFPEEIRDEIKQIHDSVLEAETTVAVAIVNARRSLAAKIDVVEPTVPTVASAIADVKASVADKVDVAVEDAIKQAVNTDVTITPVDVGN